MQTRHHHIALVVTAIVVFLIAFGSLQWVSSRDSTSAPIPTRSGPLPAATTQPHPELSPDDVVKTVMAALKNNDAPQPDSGIATTFAFASPQNKQMTGPLERFIALVHNPLYAPMLNSRSIEYGPLRVTNGRADLAVKVIDTRGQTAIYLFQLSRQTDGEFKDCWMTDGVLLVPPDATTQPIAPPLPPPVKTDGPQQA